MTNFIATGPDARPLRILRRPPPTPGEEALCRVQECLALAFQPVGAADRSPATRRAAHLPRLVAPSKRPGNETDAYLRRVTKNEPSEDDIRTEISFQPEVPTMERRSDDRSKISVYRSAMLRWSDYEALCLIRNISPGGLMGKLHTSLPPDEPVTVEIRSGNHIAGRIAWAADGMVGVQFDEKIDVLEVLHAPIHGDPGLTQRMPRLRVACPVGLVAEGMRVNVPLVDVSQGGVKIEADFLREGDDVTVSVRGLDPHRGVVRWVRDGRAGIAFLTAIPFDTLAKWALDRQAELAAKV
ncbi:PilZ domain-containing protein [Sphingomonas sp. KR3-1]|uniref:PilZ domain-containing protein n=1 Tax=Sphingomonas sp. KR3-1 TaxID=3156611 RepID=UPI0032B5CF2D